MLTFFIHFLMFQERNSNNRKIIFSVIYTMVYIILSAYKYVYIIPFKTVTNQNYDLPHSVARDSIV